MNNLKAKLKKQAGFTLIEMLIVVAIIAILIAIAVPMINRALESAREATDDANMRAALGIAISDVLMGEEDNTTPWVAGAGVLKGPDGGTSDQTAYYVINKDKQGYLMNDTYDNALAACGGGKGYGKGTTLKGASGDNNQGKIIKITVDKDTGEVKGTWVNS